MKAEAICGKLFDLDTPPETAETLCLMCSKDICMTYTLYVYAVTHYNNQ